MSLIAEVWNWLFASSRKEREERDRAAEEAADKYGRLSAKYRERAAHFNEPWETVEPLFFEVFAVVREVLATSQEEITLVSHLYEDLELDSTDLVEIVLELEAALGLHIADDQAIAAFDAYDSFVKPTFRFELSEDVTYPDKSERERAYAEAWAAYRAAAISDVRPALDAVGLSADSLTRLDEMQGLCRRYNLEPLSVGLLCLCLVVLIRSTQE